tara:strand:+ start:2049 stop:2507 length:459 start_codon:yes stop_codon:yes gene_type:complete
MIKSIKIFFTFCLLYGCTYEPILLNKNFNFNFVDINSEGDQQINNLIKNRLSNNTKKNSDQNFEIYFLSKKVREVVTSNTQGDPAIFKIIIKLKYKISQNNKEVLANLLSKQVTYNNIDDKFELLKYEENIIKSLSEKFADDILMSVTAMEK